MTEISKIENQIIIILIPFILNLITKINENSFLTIVIKSKKFSNLILYFSSIFSSLILNIFSIILGFFLHYLIKADVINNFFLIIIFSLYGLLCLIYIGRICSNKNEEDNKIIDNLIDSSSDDSEKPKIYFDSDKLEEEIELDTIKLDEIDDERSNNNFKNFKKGKINNKKKIMTAFNLKNYMECLKIIIPIEFGEKMQIFNLVLSSKFMKLNYLIIGNFCGILIINAILVFFGKIILQKRINNLFYFLEAFFYFSFSFYYIYILYF
jgi:putative Ca2+/H+ antiporter (TMEM165/GDT1 family)